MVVPDLNGTQFVRYGHIPMGTNNQGEIFGSYYLLHMMHKRTDLKFKIMSDSQYTIKSVTEWRKKWVLSNYAGIKNTNLLVPLFDMWDAHGGCRYVWVKGHADNPGNILADKYAVMGKKQQVENRKEMGWNVRYVPFQEIEHLFKG
ncbi:ribonuclease H [Ralstonia phage RSP15]|uniref:Rnase H n=1 Tax=Ralstonia phage RSP15 TaxID=1785960 RepID=UPI00074D4991|nr:Rnase H [Ralstonia phage RSP15]BAU40197.1 ribonuclease H [Ralstonia phage RSP15]